MWSKYKRLLTSFNSRLYPFKRLLNFTGSNSNRGYVKNVGEMPYGRKQVLWRRERDSNPRYRYQYNGFRDRPIRPLWHLSG